MIREWIEDEGTTDTDTEEWEFCSTCCLPKTGGSHLRKCACPPDGDEEE
jgi:hypothetical protein